MTKYTHIRDHPLLETSLFFTMSYCTFLAAEAAQMTGNVTCTYVEIVKSFWLLSVVKHGICYQNVSPYVVTPVSLIYIVQDIKILCTPYDRATFLVSGGQISWLSV